MTMTPDLSGPSDRILGLFLPEYKQLKIRVGYHTDFYPEVNINKMFYDFLPKDKSAKATIILFTQAYDNNSTITSLIRLRYNLIILLNFYSFDALNFIEFL